MLKANFSSIPEQISYMRQRYPQSIALTYSGQQLSYEEFDRRADQFAGYLAHFGIGQGSTVAVCTERSFDWIVAALGIMRTGATYVPLDSAWPDSRLRYAVEDSCASIIVSRAELLSRLRVKAHGIDPSRDAAKIAASPQVPNRAIEPESLAYVIYTSGSTGTGTRSVSPRKIGQAIWLGWDLTLLSGKFGHIFPQAQLFASQTIASAHHRH
jgi:non-ribosomal peptide synthetase component F